MSIVTPYYLFMNLRKITKYFLFILVFVTLGIILKDSLKPKKSVNNELNKVVEQHQVVQNNTNDIILKDIRIINENKDTISISNLLTTKKLIYRFSELHCDSCIINEFENLKNLLISNEMDVKDVLIISYYQNPRNLSIFKRINRLQDFEIYNLENNSLGDFEIDDMLIPYFFMLDKNLKIGNTFIPIKQANKRTDNYLKKVLLNLKE